MTYIYDTQLKSLEAWLKDPSACGGSSFLTEFISTYNAWHALTSARGDDAEHMKNLAFGDKVADVIGEAVDDRSVHYGRAHKEKIKDDISEALLAMPEAPKAAVTTNLADYLAGLIGYKSLDEVTQESSQEPSAGSTGASSG